MRGGDWCDAFAISQDMLAISVGDVCGRGSAAHEVMLYVRDAIRARAYCSGDLLEIMASANEAAYGRNCDLPVTAVVGMLETSTRTLSLTNAGHPRPLVHNRGISQFIGKLPGSLPLGIAPEYNCTVNLVTLPADALLIFYTDGIVERNRDAITGERELVLTTAHVYRSPYLNAANAIAHELTDGKYDLDDDAAVVAVRMP